jgi:predicted nucleic acid-binding protein
MVQSFLMDLAMLPIGLQQIRVEAVFNRIEALSRRHNLTAYDAAYLDVALENGLPLATLDEALVRASGTAGVSLVHA